MIKLSGTNKKTGRSTIILGLEEMNIERMRKGFPVHIHGETIGFNNLEIVVLLGKDTDELQKMLSPLIGPETVVRDHRNEKPS